MIYKVIRVFITPLISIDLHDNSVNLWFMTHFDVEEPGFESVHLTGSLAEVAHDQVESSGGQEVRVRATELLSPCKGLGVNIHDLRHMNYVHTLLQSWFVPRENVYNLFFAN